MQGAPGSIETPNRPFISAWICRVCYRTRYRGEWANGEAVDFVPGPEDPWTAKKTRVRVSTEITCAWGEPMSDSSSTR
jgi:hypothetical protein